MSLFGKIFGRSEPELDPYDLSSIKVDMHSHLIPGIDDGSQSMDETIAMLAKFESLGYQKVITTPHIMGDYFRNSPETILPGLEKIKNTATKLNLKIEIEAAAEYYFDESLMGNLKNKQPLMTFGDKYVLFEFSFHDTPSQIDGLFFEFLTQDYKPVLAHFERYPYYFGKFDQAEEWREKGINIQMNLNSLTGHYGPEVKRQAEKLIDLKLIDFVGSDCHRMEHLMTLESNLRNAYFHKLDELELKNRELV